MIMDANPFDIDIDIDAPRINMSLDADAARIWLHIRDSGGWLSAADVHAHWAPTFLLELVQAKLQMLSERRFLARLLDINAGAWVYRIDDECMPLPGYSLEPSTC